MKDVHPYEHPINYSLLQCLTSSDGYVAKVTQNHSRVKVLKYRLMDCTDHYSEHC